MRKFMRSVVLLKADIYVDDNNLEVIYVNGDGEPYAKLPPHPIVPNPEVTPDQLHEFMAGLAVLSLRASMETALKFMLSRAAEGK